MGGDWLPNTLVLASDELYNQLKAFIDVEDWYRLAAVKRDGESHLIIRDGNDLSRIEVNEKSESVSRKLLELGDDAALVLDRQFNQCFTTTWTAAMPPLDYSIELDDEDYETGGS